MNLKDEKNKARIAKGVNSLGIEAREGQADLNQGEHEKE